MNESFTPSLVISLGPSGKKALDFSKKLLSYLPRHFSDLIHYYDVESLDKLAVDVQRIIDSGLLSARYLNRLVDMGYKVRNENISTVKVNIYVLWDVYDNSVSSYEVIKALSELNYGNIDKDQHSGAAIYILSIMEKEWLLDEGANAEALDRLKEVVGYISREDSMLSIDSKVYILHSVSKDGTRIPKEELVNVCAVLTYLNIIPSKEPPLSNFNRRLLMHEGTYKVGTVGITSITVFKDRLSDEFSRYLAADMINNICSQEGSFNYGNLKVFDMLEYKNQQKDLRWGMEQPDNIEADERLKINLPDNREEYGTALRNWQNYVEKQYVLDMKNNIDQNLVLNNGEIIQNINKDLKDITTKVSLKEGLKYLYRLESKIQEQKSVIRPAAIHAEAEISKEFQHHLNNCPELTGYAVKVLILTVFMFYSMVNLLFPYVDSGFKLVFSFIFFTAAFVAAYYYFLSSREKLVSFMDKFKEEVILRRNSTLNSHLDKKILEGYEEVLRHVYEKRETLTNGFNKFKSMAVRLTPVETEDEPMGNLITDLLDFGDRHRFYMERSQEMSEKYTDFLKDALWRRDAEGELDTDKLLQLSREIADKYTNLDLYEYMMFKFKKNIDEEIKRWIEKGGVKSQYLLQHSSSSVPEEHSFFMASPKVFEISKDVVSSKLQDCRLSIADGDGMFSDSISIIRVCLGIDLNSIASVRRMERREESA